MGSAGSTQAVGKETSALARRQAWDDQGFFVVRGLVGPAQIAAIEHEVVACIRRAPPEANPGKTLYPSGPNYAIFPEKEPGPDAVNAEDRIAKVFNCHAEGMARTVASSPAIVDLVEEILGTDVDCFQSQFIFKNPGVIGQPWHQDSYYFRFAGLAQVGVWVALSRATLENGCLWVLPGSHKGPIHRHVPDRRPAANHAYMEIVDQDDTARVPCLLDPGDVLFFHSHLMHMSTDNVASERRATIVYHYAHAGARAENPGAAEAISKVNRWIPVRRRRSPGQERKG